MENKFDIDIDVPNRNAVLSSIPGVIAMQHRDGKKVKHNTGVYFLDIPANPFTNISNIEYSEAEDFGYMKLDILNVHLYELIKTESELIELMGDPDWNLLMNEKVVSELFQLGSYFDLVSTMAPVSITQLAMVLAIVRPSKRHLIGSSWEYIEQEIWKRPPDGGYYFKKSHAISYAQAVVVQLNMIKSGYFGDLIS